MGCLSFCCIFYFYFGAFFDRLKKIDKMPNLILRIVQQNHKSEAGTMLISETGKSRCHAFSASNVIGMIEPCLPCRRSHLPLPMRMCDAFCVLIQHAR